MGRGGGSNWTRAPPQEAHDVFWTVGQPISKAVTVFCFPLRDRDHGGGVEEMHRYVHVHGRGLDVDFVK